ncbi:hypothetical protein E1212_21005 [Jiangella ureilytica]|uniref:Uncharacterized protein n=1 Tax=Jiangella ureilytica TaxID=2530374 RepID=A0A4R4RGS8_9ACTN|nr:hypothetical protein [Jiangella ureilytica]TDC48494.1 hypothetical protein E1212_21005 [Jiangella ureilytica]
MNDFDDELRRILGDERLSLNARTDAVGRIVKGAQRRRTTRMVASAAGSVGLVAALAVGSVAVSGQFTAAPNPAPANTPTTLETPAPPTVEETPAPPSTLMTPDATETGEAVEPPTGETPDTPPDDETEAPPATDPGGETGTETGAETGTEGGEDPTTEDPAAGKTVIYPNEGIDGYTVGTPLTELETIPGVVITPYEPGTGYHEACYGEYRSANAHGLISVRGSWGEYPDDLRPHFEVATMHFDIPVATPEGIAAGSTESDVLAAYTDPTFTDDGYYRAVFYGENVIMRAWHFLMSGGEVAEVVMDGAAQCDRQPITDPPPGG